MDMEYSNLLNVTNLTKYPLDDIKSKLNGAIDEAIKDGAVINKDGRADILTNFAANTDEILAEIKPVDLLGFVDNLIVNYDYLAFVLEQIE